MLLGILCCGIDSLYFAVQDWARNHSGDPEIEAALKRGEDPGLALVSRRSLMFGLLSTP